MAHPSKEPVTLVEDPSSVHSTYMKTNNYLNLIPWCPMLSLKLHGNCTLIARIYAGKYPYHKIKITLI